MKQKFLFLIAILAGIFGASLAHFWLQTKNREYDDLKESYTGRMQRVSIVAAKTTLPAGTEIKLDDIGQDSQMFASYVSYDHITLDEYRRILGRKLTRVVEAGKPILWSYIEGGKDERMETLSVDIDARNRMRAVSIPVAGAAGVSGMVRPNDRVDVLASFILPVQDGAPDEAEQVVKTILQNVTVLAIGSETHRSLRANTRGASGGYSAVTLQVTPREAEVLVFAQLHQSRLFLTLRNPTDVYFEDELPRIDFNQIEEKLQELNKFRQENINKARRTP